MKEKNQVMTANRLGDGAVVYLAEDDDWVLSLDAAEIAESEEEAIRLEERAGLAMKQQKVVGPYLFAVSVTGEYVAPISQREIIRAAGPTVGTDLPETTPLR
ncbi:DUF2849 domain-containing protein [Nisaea acidiphila]|uniref:DUF2849 domain-containing protein n=1 Tax=Nisaea acidiphila TaxID=1862145 RepID=A0A9J7AQM8_9PROT|nr:DUF2849 domain-containing protein [Nisaea acidiphila]UUX49907.1 DUF2849 domain-containing protein [Nisaea acidiphila]